MIYIVFHRHPTAFYVLATLSRAGGGDVLTTYRSFAGSETNPSTFLTAQRKSNVEHKISSYKLPALLFSFCNIYSCLHCTLFLTLFSKQVSLLLGKKTLTSILIFLSELKNLGKGKHGSLPIRNIILKSLRFLTTTQLYFTSCCCLSLGAGV